MRMDADGNEIGGQWTITPAIQLHVQIHKAGPTCGCRSTPLALGNDLGGHGSRARDLRPDGAFYHGRSRSTTSTGARSTTRPTPRRSSRVMGDANVGLLQNHGVVILADNIHQAYLRAIAFEWRCEQAWRIAAAGGGKPDETRPRRELRRLSSTPRTSAACSRPWWRKQLRRTRRLSTDAAAHFSARGLIGRRRRPSP